MGINYEFWSFHLKFIRLLIEGYRPWNSNNISWVFTVCQALSTCSHLILPQAEVRLWTEQALLGGRVTSLSYSLIFASLVPKITNLSWHLWEPFYSFSRSAHFIKSVSNIYWTLSQNFSSSVSFKFNFHGLSIVYKKYSPRFSGLHFQCGGFSPITHRQTPSSSQTPSGYPGI